MRSRQKSLNVGLQQPDSAGQINILAFFYVVASSQISPHHGRRQALSGFGCKDSEKFRYARGRTIVQEDKLCYLCIAKEPIITINIL